MFELFLDHSDRIELDARHNVGEDFGLTAFMIACKYGHKDVVQLLLNNSKIELNAICYSWNTGLTLACENGHKDVVELLLNNSNFKYIDLDATNIDGKTAIILAGENGHKDVVYLILEQAKKYYEYKPQDIEDILAICLSS